MQNHPLSHQFADRFIQTLSQGSGYIRLAYLSGFEDGSRIALTTVADKLKKDLEASVFKPDQAPTVQMVADFIQAVAQAGVIKPEGIKHEEDKKDKDQA